MGTEQYSVTQENVTQKEKALIYNKAYKMFSFNKVRSWEV
jgi:hypothetical protein